MGIKENQRIKLTDDAVERLRHDGPGFTLYRDTVEPGFCVRVYGTGRKVFYWNGRARGEAYNRKIGTFDSEYRSGNARKDAALTRVSMNNGIDPLVEQRARRAEKAAARLKTDEAPLTLGAAITALANARKRAGKIGDTTFNDYTGLRDLELAPYCDTPLANIDRKLAETWLREIAQAIRKRRKSFDGHSRANKAIRLVRTTMISNKLENPCAKVGSETFPWFKEGERECDLEPHHAPPMWQNISAAGTDERAAFYGTLMLTGMRSIEALRLTADDVDLELGVITLTHTKNKSNHKVYISAQLDALLRPIMAGKRKTAKLFPNCEHIAPQLHKVCDAAKAPRSSNHDLRKLWAITAMDLGVAYPIIKKCLNHSSGGDVTLGHYAKPTPSQLRAAWQRVADYIAPAVQDANVNNQQQKQSV